MERTVDIAAIALVLALPAIPNNSPASANDRCLRHTNASFAGVAWRGQEQSYPLELSKWIWRAALPQLCPSSATLNRLGRDRGLHIMRELLTAVPDWQALLTFSQEELGEQLLFLMKQRQASRPSDHRHGFEPAAIINELWVNLSDVAHPYPEANKLEINEALGEAWNWLEREGYVVPVGGMNGVYGWRQLSTKAKKLESKEALRALISSKRHARDIMHPTIAALWPRIMRCELDGAVFEAMHAVEVAVRDRACLRNADIGVGLMRSAFHQEKGALTDKEAEGGERQALSDLFAGAIGTYKNPRSHRRVNLANADEAIEILMLASNLLRIVERAGAQDAS